MVNVSMFIGLIAAVALIQLTLGKHVYAEFCVLLIQDCKIVPSFLLIGMTDDLETELIKIKLRQLEHKMKQLQLASGNENIYKEIQPRKPTHANEQNENVIDSDRTQDLRQSGWAS